MTDKPPTAEASLSTTVEGEEFAKPAFGLESQIKAAFARAAESWWELARLLYEFQEAKAWKGLGYDTLAEFLAQPELGMSTRQFFQMTKLHRDLVVVRQIEPEVLSEVEPSKAREVAPAIMRGDVAVEDALDDARRPGPSGHHGQDQEAAPGCVGRFGLR